MQRSNGLARLAGTWTQEEHKRFEAAIAATDQIDDRGAALTRDTAQTQRNVK